MDGAGGKAMNHLLVFGLQWGDEGKGKIVDCLADHFDAVVRFQGGHNAGHTVIVKHEKKVLHLLPSGILRPQVHCLIANGVVLSLPHLYQELQAIDMDSTEAQARLSLSCNCPLLFHCHRLLDQAREQKRTDAIGTTCRGIGPAYEDKVARRALRLSDLLDEKRFAAQLKELVDYHNTMLRHYYHFELCDYQSELDDLMSLRDYFLPMMTDVSAKIMALRSAGKKILYEGAQGVLLDIDHGTYPYVTSSNTVPSAVAVGSGVSLNDDIHKLGVVKAYATRVGAGPFPTELHNEVGMRLARQGNEFGATTGRARRCGWLDVCALRYAIAVSGVDSLCLTKLDVLSGLTELRLCTEYQGASNGYYSYGAQTCAAYKPSYYTMAGWDEDITGLRDGDALPAAARDYIDYIESFVEVPISIVSTGRTRDDSIIRQPHFFDCRQTA